MPPDITVSQSLQEVLLTATSVTAALQALGTRCTASDEVCSQELTVRFKNIFISDSRREKDV